MERFGGGGESEREGDRCRRLVTGCELLEASLEVEGILDKLADGLRAPMAEGLLSAFEVVTAFGCRGKGADLSAEDGLALEDEAGTGLTTEAGLFFGIIEGAGFGTTEVDGFPGIVLAEGVLILETGVGVSFSDALGLDPNQSWNSRASSPSRSLDSRSFCRSRTISSIVRVSRLTTLSFVRVLGMAARRARTESEPSEEETGGGVDEFVVMSMAPPGNRLPALV